MASWELLMPTCRWSLSDHSSVELTSPHFVWVGAVWRPESLMGLSVLCHKIMKFRTTVAAFKNGCLTFMLVQMIIRTHSLGQARPILYQWKAAVNMTCLHLKYLRVNTKMEFNFLQRLIINIHKHGALFIKELLPDISVMIALYYISSFEQTNDSSIFLGVTHVQATLTQIEFNEDPGIAI